MPYKDNIYLKPSIEWEKILQEAEIYELKLPKTLDKIPEGKEFERKTTTEEVHVPSYYSERERTTTVLEVTAVYTNPKNTVKALVCGKEKKVALFSRNGCCHGWTSLEVPDRYGDKTFDIFDQIKVGSFLVTRDRWWKTTDWELGFVSNEPTLENVKRILDNLLRMEKLKNANRDFSWNKENLVESYGTVSLKDVLKQKAIFDLTLRRFKWNHRKARWDLWNSVKANLSMKNDGKTLTVKVKALDGETYYFKAPALKTPTDEEELGWQEKSVYTLDWWLPFVYRKPNDRFFSYTKVDKTESLVKYLLSTFDKLPNYDLEIGMGKKRIKIERKRSSSGSKLNFLDGNLVAVTSCRVKMQEYFLHNKPILPQPPLSPSPQQLAPSLPKKRVLSTEAMKLIQEGLNGKMRDLEGEFPFHLNLLYKEEERKWYMEIAGKEYYIKGGQTALKKIRSAIEGTARKDYDKYGSGSCQTRMIKDRIAELVGEKEALEIILQVKRMGAMMKAMTGK